MQTITAVIPARNEEVNIARCIRSLKWCDKVIMLYCGNDKTAEIAEKMGAKVISYPFKRNNNFKDLQRHFNDILKHSSSNWILRVDADEVVTPELKREIKKILLKPTSIVAYGIPRQQYFFGTFLKGGDWAYDRLVRLFKTKAAMYKPIVQVHEQLKINGEIGYLKNSLLHYSHPNFDILLNKFDSYTTLEMKQLNLSYQKAIFKMFFNPPYIFLRWLFWHKGYKDGLAGILAGTYRGLYDFFLYSKYLEYKLHKKNYK